MMVGYKFHIVVVCQNLPLDPQYQFGTYCVYLNVLPDIAILA